MTRLYEKRKIAFKSDAIVVNKFISGSMEMVPMMGVGALPMKLLDLREIIYWKSIWLMCEGEKDMDQFDSDYCNVTYVEKDNVVLLTWKRYAEFDDYRKPTLFALELLSKYPDSNFVVDATHGFEDNPKDVEWGTQVLIPKIGKTDCKFVCFIMSKANEMEEEMDRWIEEFGKYVAVVSADDYQAVLERMHRLLMVNVRYYVRSGKREEFLRKVSEQGIIRDSKGEPGNVSYEYFVPVNSKDELCLQEIWTNEVTQKSHGETLHYQKLQILKQEYVMKVELKKYWVKPEA